MIDDDDDLNYSVQIGLACLLEQKLWEGATAECSSKTISNGIRLQHFKNILQKIYYNTTLGYKWKVLLFSSYLDDICHLPLYAPAFIINFIYFLSNFPI